MFGESAIDANGSAIGFNGSAIDANGIAIDTNESAIETTIDTIAFNKLVHSEGRRLYRALPWREVDDAYLVLCSEVMLQQTQVSRVLKYWQRWVSAFPTVDALASASVADVLELWQGLGYNRRALALKKSAEICSEQNAGTIPQTLEGLLALPGVGQATAAGVCVFAYKQVQVYLETNIRTVFIHHFFENQDKVHDREIMKLVKASCDVDDPRGWYYALLDYGNYLKSILPNPSRRSSHYTRQSTFKGSIRQKRAFLLREALRTPLISTDMMLESLNLFEKRAGLDTAQRKDVQGILSALASEGFLVACGEDCWSIAK